MDFIFEEKYKNIIILIMFFIIVILGGLLVFKECPECEICEVCRECNSVVVEETIDGDDVELVLTVHEDDTGMVIGHHGRIAKAIRQVMKAAANTKGKHVTVEIK